MSKFTQKLNCLIYSSLFKDRTKKSSMNNSNILYFRNKKSNPIPKLSNYNNLLYNNIVNPTSKTVINPYSDINNQPKKIKSKIDNNNLTKYISKLLISTSQQNNKNINSKINMRKTSHKSKYIPKPNSSNTSYSKNKSSNPLFRKSSYSVTRLIKYIKNTENNKSMLNTSSSSISIKNIKLSHRLNNGRVENKIIKQIELIKGENKEKKIKNILINRPPRTLNSDVCKFNSKEYCSLLPSTRLINSHRMVKNYENKNKNINNAMVNFDEIKSNDNFYRMNRSCYSKTNYSFYCSNNNKSAVVTKKNRSCFNYNDHSNNKSTSIFDKMNNNSFYLRGNFFGYENKHASSNNNFY